MIRLRNAETAGVFTIENLSSLPFLFPPYPRTAWPTLIWWNPGDA
jgi:hypothetical protein